MMQFKNFHWLSHHCMRAIIPRPTNMVSIHLKLLECFYFYFRYFKCMLVGFEIIIASSVLHASFAIYRTMSIVHLSNNW